VFDRGGHGTVNHINRTEVWKWFGITEPNRLRFGTNRTEPNQNQKFEHTFANLIVFFCPF